MTAEEYQAEAHGFATYGDESYPYFGLAEEAGEVLGKVAKFTRHNDGMTPWVARDGFPNAMKTQNSQFRDDVKKELGDVLWMLSEIATANGLTLGEIMSSNIVKLRDRRDRGVIDGSGDDR